MMIDVKVIPHREQRYETAGDWWFNPDNTRLTIRVSRMGNEDFENLVSLHEQTEALLCLKRGICEKQITAFDIEFEKNRADGNTDEPGDAPNAPYKKEHFFATSIERLIAAELGVDWKEYDDAIQAL